MNLIHCLRPCFLPTVAAALCFVTAANCGAAVRKWAAFSASNDPRLMSVPSNWNPPGVPVNGDSIILDYAVTITNDLTGLSLQNIEIGKGAIDGNALTVTGSIKTRESDGVPYNLYALRLPIKLGGPGTARTWYIERSLELEGSVDLNGRNLTFEFKNGADVEVSGTFTGTGDVNFSGLFYEQYGESDSTVTFLHSGVRASGITRVDDCTLDFDLGSNTDPGEAAGTFMVGRAGEVTDTVSGGEIFATKSNIFAPGAVVQLGHSARLVTTRAPRVEFYGGGYLDRGGYHYMTIADDIVVKRGATGRLTGLAGISSGEPWAMRVNAGVSLVAEPGGVLELQTQLDDNDAAADVPVVLEGGGVFHMSVGAELPKRLELVSGELTTVVSRDLFDTYTHVTVREQGVVVYRGPGGGVLYPDMLLDDGKLRVVGTQVLRSKLRTFGTGVTAVEVQGMGTIEATGMLTVAANITGTGGVAFKGTDSAVITLDGSYSGASTWQGDARIAVGRFREEDNRLRGAMTYFGDGTQRTVDFSGSVDGDITVTGGTTAYIGTPPVGCDLTITGTATVYPGYSPGVERVIVTGFDTQASLRGDMRILNSIAVNGAGATALTIAGKLKGGDSISKTGAGALRFSGSEPGEFYGTLRVMEGSVDLQRQTGTAAFGSALLDIGQQSGAGAMVRVLSNGALNADTRVSLRTTGVLDMSALTGSRPELLGSLSGGGMVMLPANGLAAGADDTASTFSGSFSGAGAFIKTGGGVMTLNGDHSHTGATRIAEGALVVNGRLFNSATEVLAGTLMGTGTLQALTVRGDGTLAPGGEGTPGTLACGNLLMDSGAALRARIAGTAAAPLNDRVNANGTVSIGGAVLDLRPATVPNVGTVFRVLDRLPAGTISGNFAGVAQGSTFNAAFLNLTATYTGGSGNDFALTYASYNENPAHQPPSFPQPPAGQASEHVIYSLTLAATDPDPTQTLRYELTTAAPPGLKLNAATGVIAWNPPETEGGSSVVLGLKVTDNGAPPLSASTTLTINVAETNQAPKLNDGENYGDYPAVNEGDTLVYSTFSSDSDRPVQTMHFAFTGSVPAGMTIDPNTGVITWPTTEANGGTSPNVTVVCTDNGSPPLSDTQTYTIPVARVENLPLPRNEVVSVIAGQTLSFSMATTDPDQPPQTIYYRMPAGNYPQPVSIDQSGLVTWVTTEADGPGTYTFVFEARNVGGGVGPFSPLTLEVNVTTNNTAPKLRPIPDQVVAPGELLEFYLRGTDSDIPAQFLSYSGVNGAPQGMTINPETGRVRWTPTAAQDKAMYEVTVQVTDEGTPPLSTQRTFRVFVRSGPTPALPAVTFEKRPAAPGYRMRFTLPAGSLYEVQSSNDMTGTWTSRGVFVAAGGGETFIDTPGGAVERRFYRLFVP